MAEEEGGRECVERRRGETLKEGQTLRRYERRR